MNGNQTIRFSVIIGLVSTEDRERIRDCLSALRGQRGDHALEVIVADRRNDEISRQIAEMFPEVSLIACDPGTSLPELRTIALRHARGEFILVTEDHCIPDVNWLSGVSEAFARAPSSAVAVGGCIENGLTSKAWDWATYLCEYSGFAGPIREGNTVILPGGNIAYRRDILAGQDNDLLTSGFWESTLHPRLLGQGYTFLASNDIVVYHLKAFSFRLFITQRFSYSRYYASMHSASHGRAWRTVAAFASLAVPLLAFYRIATNALGRGRLRIQLLRSTPWLLLFTLIWGLGESWGHLFGPGRALAEIE